MSLEFERRGNDPGGAPGLEDFVAREHWRPIAVQAGLQATALVLVAALLAIPVPVAFSTMYFITLIGAIFAGIMAPRVAAQDRGAAVHIARRCVASLAVSGLSLLAFALTFDGTLPIPPATPAG